MRLYERVTSSRNETSSGRRADWEVSWDDQGRQYFYNSRNQLSLWEAPVGAQVRAGSGSSATFWTVSVDDESGEQYFYREETGDIRWSIG